MGSPTFLKTVHRQLFYTAFIHLIQKRKKYMQVYENIRKVYYFCTGVYTCTCSKEMFSDVHKLYRFISVMIYNNDPRREKIC